MTFSINLIIYSLNFIVLIFFDLIKLDRFDNVYIQTVVFNSENAEGNSSFDNHFINKIYKQTNLVIGVCIAVIRNLKISS